MATEAVKPEIGDASFGRAISVGAILGFDMIGYCVALASVAFAGSLSFAVGLGTLIFMLSTVVMSLALSWRSAFPGAIGLAQDAGIAVLAPGMILAATLVQGSPEEKLATALAILGLSTLITGIALLMMGTFRLGRVARVVPFPVAAGFPASSGWLLVLAGFSLVTGSSGLTGLAQDIAMQNIPWNLIFAAMLVVSFFVSHRFVPGAVAVAVPLVIATIVFYVVLTALGYSIADARALGLLTTASENAVALPDLSFLAYIHWPIVLGTSTTIAAVILINIIGFVLNTGAIELSVGSDVDMDREARLTGATNIAIGAFGGGAGYIGLGHTALAHMLGGNGRITGLSMALITLIGSVFATTIVTHVPVFAAGSIVLFMGLSMLDRWVVQTWSRLPRRDWVIIAIILLTTMSVGVIAAIAVGTAIALLIFVMTYARMPVVRFQTSGAARRSTVDRAAEKEAVLAKEGERIHILSLQGYLFFGSVEQLLQEIRNRIARSPALQTLVVDFTHMRGMDSAACAAIAKFGHLAQRNEFNVSFAAVPKDVRDLMELWGISFSGDSPFREANNLDQAIEAAEDRLLARFGQDVEADDVSNLFDRLTQFHPRGAELFALMEPVEMLKGDVLITSGSTSGDIYFLEKGRVSVWVQHADGGRMRVRSMRPGAVVGEAARYLGRTRTADVIVDAPSLIYTLPDAVIDRMERDESGLAAVLHSFLAKNLSEKLSRNNYLLSEMQK